MTVSNMSDEKMNKSKKFETTVVGPEAKKIAEALCKGKDFFFASSRIQRGNLPRLKHPY